MARSRSDETGDQAAEPTSPTPETTEATEKQAADVFTEFLKTGRVREGYAVNVMWPEKARRLKKD